MPIEAAPFGAAVVAFFLTRFAPEPTRAKPAKRGQPLDGEEPWFARPASQSYGRRRSNDEDRDKTYFELSLSPARNRRAPLLLALSA